MKIEKVLGCVLAVLVVLCAIVYFTLPEQGEQIYIPPVKDTLPEGVEIPDGFLPVENFNDVYYVETEDGIRYYLLVQFTDGSYGWQEVDENGNFVLPNRESEPTESIPEQTDPEPTEEPTDPAPGVTDPVPDESSG